jgi:hypothetical protein
MAPSNPLEYSPTVQLVLGLLFFVFPLIYICCRISTYVLFEFVQGLKLLLVPIFHLYFQVDESPENHTPPSNVHYGEKPDILIDTGVVSADIELSAEEFTETDESFDSENELEDPR